MNTIITLFVCVICLIQFLVIRYLIEVADQIKTSNSQLVKRTADAEQDAGYFRTQAELNLAVAQNNGKIAQQLSQAHNQLAGQHNTLQELYRQRTLAALQSGLQQHVIRISQN